MIPGYNHHGRWSPGGGGVGMVSQDWPEGWISQSMRFHGPSVVSCKIVYGDQRTPLIVVYFRTSNLDHLLDLDEALNLFFGRNPVVLGDLNADIGCLRNPHNQQVAEFLASFGLVDLLGHFRQRPRFCHLHMWWKVLQGRVLRSHCDYVLGSDRWLFNTVGIWDPRKFASDHFALCARLLRRPTLFHVGEL